MHYFQLETNEKQRFVFQMKYGKHPVSTSVIYQLYGYFRHFAEHFTCNSNFRGCNRPRKLKTANIYPHILRQKHENLATRKYSILRYYYLCWEHPKTPPVVVLCLKRPRDGFPAESLIRQTGGAGERTRGACDLSTTPRI